MNSPFRIWSIRIAEKLNDDKELAVSSAEDAEVPMMVCIACVLLAGTGLSDT